MRFMIAAAVLSFAAPLPVLAGEMKVERIDVVDAGIYSVEIGDVIADPEVPTSSVATPVAAELIEETTAITGKPGIEFGFRYVVVGEPAGADVALDYVFNYPPPGLIDPDAPEPMLVGRITREKSIGETHYVGYGFEEDWEIVPGEWSFEIWRDGEKLASRTFSVSR